MNTGIEDAALLRALADDVPDMHLTVRNQLRDIADKLETAPQGEPVAQVVEVYPAGPDGYEVNWLLGNKTKPGDLLYAAPPALKHEQKPVAWIKYLIGTECKSNGNSCDVVFLPTEGYTPLFTHPAPAPLSEPSWLLESTQELARSIAKRCYPEVPQFEVLDDLAGVISQIDNMTTGMERKPTVPAPLSKTLDHSKWEHDLKPMAVMGNFPENYAPLTDEQIEDIWRSCKHSKGYPATAAGLEFGRAIERHVRGGV